jgi:hypothetical protein
MVPMGSAQGDLKRLPFEVDLGRRGREVGKFPRALAVAGVRRDHDSRSGVHGSAGASSTVVVQKESGRRTGRSDARRQTAHGCGGRSRHGVAPAVGFDVGAEWMWDSGSTADGWMRATSGAAACWGDGGCWDSGIQGIRMGEARLVLSMGQQGGCGRGMDGAAAPRGEGQ